MEFSISHKNENAVAKIAERSNSGGLIFADFSLEFAEPTVPQPVKVEFFVPLTDMLSCFSPVNMYQRNIAPSWRKRTSPSRLASGAPVSQMISADAKNRLTVALSDAANPTEIAFGVIERNAMLQCVVTFFTQPVNRVAEYRATLRVDLRDLRYEQVLKDTEAWWAGECGYPSAYIPDIARQPLYSTWYSFHQNVNPDEIVRQCELARTYGMKNVIVDDGWQIAPDEHGYINCGDWEPCPEKVPDMRDFVDRVHRAGLKYTMWYSLPAFGVNSAAHERFRDMLLNPSATTWAAYDPRFPEVRRYMCDILSRAIRDWDLDGVKLDFIDSFKLSPETPAFDPRWDTLSLEDGVDKLLSDINSALRKVKPDVMIEFRQSYFGPVIRKYGNMIRVGDCPNDAIRNHIAGIDLRFLLGKTAVHSDMLMWHPEDSVEQVAYQMIGTLFLVPQISVLLDRIPKAHQDTLRFYLDFWTAHRDTLLDGNLTAENPEVGYSLVCSEGEGELVAVAYSRPVLEKTADRDIFFINATAEDRLWVRPEHALGTRTVRIFRPTGDIVTEKTVRIGTAVREFRVPRGGMVAILRDNGEQK